jgi:hypothetical protein
MPELIPFRWPQEWKDPSKLELLKGTPINCLVGEAPPPFPLGSLQFVKLTKNETPKDIAVREGMWPRILPSEKKDDAAEAGPTGSPWVDSSAGVIRLAQIMEPGKPVWLSFLPPSNKDNTEVIPLNGFVKPIAEACSFGARWVITLSPSFIQRLDARNDEALGSWNRMVAALKFFETHAEWKSWKPVAALAAISTFEGDNELMGAEFLVLAPRRQLAYHAVRTEDALKADLSALKAVVYIDAKPPEGELRKKLLAFAEAGGLLISPRGIVTGTPVERRVNHQIYTAGKGKIAVPLEAWFDPYLLVREVHLLMSHREDVVRVWNGADVGTHMVAGAQPNRAVVHLTQYASARTQPLTIGVGKAYRLARVFNLESEKTVKPVRGELGTEIQVGEFAAYAAVELEA